MKYVNNLLNVFKFWRDTYVLKTGMTEVVLGYWKIRGLAASIRYQLKYCGVEF